MKVKNPFGNDYAELILPDTTNVLHMLSPEVVKAPSKYILSSLENPIGTPPLSSLARLKIQKKPTATACIIVSDNTRPVPYKGEEGILLPIIRTLLEAGFKTEKILVIVATGTHRAMRQDELEDMIDPAVFNFGIRVINHDCENSSMLSFRGVTSRGTQIYINKYYVEADLKIATGLVESHFMAGASGGRKAVCPGLIGKASTFVFHGPAFMDHPNSRDLIIEGNPVHEESLEVAKTVGVDFLVNVTLNHAFHITGVFSGDLEKAHFAAVEKIKESVNIKIDKEADVVITHGGFVGINHYQCAKSAVAALGALKENGYLIIIANLKDRENIIGSINYRTTLALLKLQGYKNFLKVIMSSDWSFIPEQWQVQMWAKVFKKIPMEHLLFFAPQLEDTCWPGLPGIDAGKFVKNKKQPDCFTKAVIGALSFVEKQKGVKLDNLDIAFIQEGPYSVPMKKV